MKLMSKYWKKKNIMGIFELKSIGYYKVISILNGRNPILRLFLYREANK